MDQLNDLIKAALTANTDQQHHTINTRPLEIITIDDDEESIDDYDDNHNDDEEEDKYETVVENEIDDIEIVDEVIHKLPDMHAIRKDIGRRLDEYINDTKSLLDTLPDDGLVMTSLLDSCHTITAVDNVATTSSSPHESDSIPNKIKRILSPKKTKKVKDPNKVKADPDVLVQSYLQTFSHRMIELNGSGQQTEDLADKLNIVFDKLKQNNNPFLQSSQFEKLVTMFRDEVSAMTSDFRVIAHHNDLLIEMNRLTQEPKKAAKKSAVKDKTKAIERLTLTLKKLQRQMVDSENEVLDYEAMGQRSKFTDIPKLARRIQQVWEKREELLKRSTNCGRTAFKRFKYEGTSHPDINKCVEDIFNTHMKKLKSLKSRGYVDESFTFIDLRKQILDVIQEKNLSIMNTESTVEMIYRDLLNEKRSRRMQDTEETIETLELLDDLKPETMPTNDPEVEIEIAKNKSLYERKLQDLFQKYAEEDKRKNGDLIKNGLTEWENNLDEDNEEFESLDVKEGELEAESSDDDEDKEDKEEEENEEINFGDTSVPNFDNRETIETENITLDNNNTINLDSSQSIANCAEEISIC
ncbi:uncharacterized protein LOC128955260 [Oppia nitens]|uniref:uncharacterized protein LOC128955260 n=1 Tax=Oppia nitens TaxID=1686743 RepID=UPI0023DB12F4|nr:uncharacterized protein LOC128955260 [Oppia nitens]